jgi:hypothetical protein
MVTSQRDPIPWVIALFIANFLLQRLSIPGISIPLTVPFAVLWLSAALYFRVVALNQRRFTLWLVAGAASALVVIPQLFWVQAPFISVNSWAFWMVVWLPVVVHLRDRSEAQFQRCLKAVSQFGLALSALSLTFIAVQLLGVPYRDVLADVIPSNFLVQGYVVSYPVLYGSPIYKSNGWIALEPSFLSFMLGVCIVGAILIKAHPLKVLFLLAGMFVTTAGSGFAVVVTAVIGLIVTNRWVLVKSYVPAAVGIAALALLTPFGQSIFGRLTEAGDDQSSTALRSVEPYRYLWPQWINDPAGVFFGRGPGSSRWVIDNNGIPGLLTPNVPKVLFDYGLIAGALLLALMLVTYIRTPEPVLAWALGLSMFTLQAASQPLVMCSIVVLTLWSPHRLQGTRTATSADAATTATSGAEPWGAAQYGGRTPRQQVGAVSAGSEEHQWRLQ